MDRAEAIKELMPFTLCDVYSDNLREACCMAIAALREQEQSKWISVKERLPESDEMILALVEGKPTENVTLIGAYELAVYDPDEKEWILEMWPEWLGAKVTHWMPLPEPPEGGVEE